MNDLDTTKLEGALRGLADSGSDPDESAAWDAIATGIAADARRGRRLKVIAGGGGAIAIGSIAAALALFGGTDDNQAVEVGPSGTVPSTVTTAPDSTGSTIDGQGTPIELPDATLVATDAARTQLYVLDATTGERVSTPLVVDAGETIWDAGIARDGTVFVRSGPLQGGGHAQIMRMSWTGDDVTPIEGLSQYVSGFAIDPSGTTLAVADHDPTTSASSIVLYDLATDEIRHVGWDADENSDWRTGGIGSIQFSPDGSQIVFDAAQDSFDPVQAFVLDADALSLSEAQPLGLQTAAPHWMPDGAIVGMRDVEIGSNSGIVYLEGGPDVGLPVLAGTLDGFVTGPTGIVARVVDGDPTLHRLDVDTDTWVELDAFSAYVIAASP